MAKKAMGGTCGVKTNPTSSPTWYTHNTLENGRWLTRKRTGCKASVVPWHWTLTMEDTYTVAHVQSTRNTLRT
ncbi:hypothetical protein GBAR_LOCUS7104 [Geodia barretti]|uniref:Uncharacterized protein n=1 Tax=Geodia barretti TaxID=519541 RepID=A0AA35RIR1_GEOBA|nr:hypothetical protein GBAR_LOCUS7104 [Geodia barretti]